MTKLRNISLALGLALLFVGGALFAEPEKKPVSEPTNGIKWLNYAEGMKAAENNDKHILIDFTASWCGWCKKMEATTFKDDSVIALVNENFIPIKVWGDSKKELDVDGYKITEENLAKHEYRVSGYPTFWFLEADGSKIAPAPGFRTSSQFKEILQYVKDRKYDTTSTKSPSQKKN